MSEIRADRSELFHYDNPDYPVFVRHNYIPAGIPLSKWTPTHWHEEVEILCIAEGVIHHRINEAMLTLRAGDCLIINSRQFHELISDEKTDCELYCLIFRPMLLASTNETARLVEAVVGNMELAYAHLRGSAGWHGEVRDRIVEVVEQVGSGKYLRGMAGLYQLWDLLAENLKNEEERPIPPGKQIVQRMTDFIDKNYRRRISLGDICEAGNVGKTKCSELFHCYFRMPPVEYLRNLRLDKAASLLRETKMSVSDIALEVGFTGASYFTEQFRQRTQLTPMAYRRLAQEQRHEKIPVCGEGPDHQESHL